MRIGELGTVTGVAPRLLRHYEAQGLLTPDRDSRGWRVYDESHRARVGRIRELVEAGLPTTAIGQLLHAADDGEVLQPSAALLAELTAVHDRIDARIRCLARNRDALAAWLARAREPEQPG
jgi:DNA-binding transcriptional MerR regulator